MFYLKRSLNTTYKWRNDWKTLFGGFVIARLAELFTFVTTFEEVGTRVKLTLFRRMLLF